MKRKKIFPLILIVIMLASMFTIFVGATAAKKATNIQTYDVVINYVFEDGTTAAYSWEGTFPAGSNYTLNVKSPSVKGYTTETTEIHEELTNISENKTYTVEYVAAKVNYTVKHWKQNINNDNYTEVEDATEVKSALTNTPVGSGLEKSYEGFKVLEYDTTTPVAADGSTVINIYYDREYYLMDFDLGGGYGVEPVYARYDAPIPDVGTPTLPGYDFTGWDQDIPSKMPAVNKTYKANWKVTNEVNVNLAFWYENANDENYTYVGGATSKVAYSDGKKVTPSEFKDVNFTGRDNYHFSFNDSKNTEVVLKADGSTLVNVYFKRNTYRLIFFNCRKCATNKDSDSCYPERTGALKYIEDNNLSDCVDKTYENGGQEWGISIYTRKWQQDVSNLWHNGIAGRSNTRRWMPYQVDGAAGQEIYTGTLNVSMMNVMPDADIVFRFLSEGDLKCTMNYWVTPVAGESITGETKKDGSITYIQRNKYTTMMGAITKNEEYVDIEGFTKVYTWDQLLSKEYRRSGDGWAEADFFYTRNSYNLTYINHGNTASIKPVEFEGLIDGVDRENSDYIPPCPSNLEEGAYKFTGWYLSQDCVAGTEVNWETERMPVGGMSVYAKWEPISHTVTTANDKDGAVTNTFNPLHGTIVENAPANPTKDGYEFIAWFYIDENGNEVPFTFDMPVYRDLTLYAKWKQAEVVEGTIFYKLKDSDIEVAAQQEVESLVGETKTYDAKTNIELYDTYQEGYFPLDASKSIVFDADKNNNMATFEYVEKDKMSYTVKYLEKDTEKVLAPAKVAETTFASVVETFIPIPGYLPDLYKKQLIISVNGDNELIFWYTEDGNNAPILRGHYLENADDDGYTTYQEISDGYGLIGTTYTEEPLTSFGAGIDFDGFIFNPDKSTTAGTLTRAGLELKLYYDRKVFPYEFRFVEEGTDKEIQEAYKSTAKYEATVSYTAPEIPGYELVPEQDPKMIIQIEEGQVAVKNIVNIYYKPSYTSLKIDKEVVGTLDENQTFIFHISGQPDNAEATKIEMDVTVNGDGEVLIKDLPVGTYTITEKNWSWRYGTTTVKVGESAATIATNATISAKDPMVEYKVTFTNERTNNQWLDGDCYHENIFNPNSAVQRIIPKNQ